VDFLAICTPFMAGILPTGLKSNFVTIGDGDCYKSKFKVFTRGQLRKTQMKKGQNLVVTRIKHSRQVTSA